MTSLILTAAAKIREFVAREEGVDLVEYGLLAALIAVVAIASVTKLGTTVSSVFTAVANSI